MYPRWFLEQGSLGRGLAAVGYSNKGYYEDSSASLAARCARENLVRERRTIVVGDQAFWATEAGTTWMGSKIELTVDSVALDNAAQDTGRGEVYFGGDFVISVVTSGALQLPDSMKRIVEMPQAEPAWVHGMVDHGSRISSIGVAPRYFYESSSWEAAERMALLELAKECGDSLMAIEKNTEMSGQTILNERFSIELRDYSVVSRWLDSKNAVYYVLMSVERQNAGRFSK